MASPSLALPGVLFVGEDERARLVAHLGPAAGWMIPRGVLGWSTEVSVVARDAITDAVKRDAKIVMPAEQIPPGKYPLANQAALKSPLIAVSSKLTQKLVDSGIRVHTVGADRVTSSFYYLAEGGGEEPIRIEGDLVAAVGAMLGDRADNAAIERVLDGLVDRLVRSLSKDRVSELSLELAHALPRAAADGTGLQDIDLDAFEKELKELVAASEKYTPFLQEIATKIGDTNDRKVDIPLYGDAKKVSQGPFELEVGTKKVALVTHERWLATGPLAEPPPRTAAKAAPVAEPKPKTPDPKPVAAKPVAATPKAEPKPVAATPKPEPKPAPQAATPKPAPTKAEVPKPAPTPKPEPKVEPVAAKVEPAKVEPPKAEPAKVEPPKAEPPKAEPAPTPVTAKVEPVPAKAEPKPEPVAAKAEPVAADAPKTKTIPIDRPAGTPLSEPVIPKAAPTPTADIAKHASQPNQLVTKAKAAAEAHPRDARLATTQKTKKEKGFPWLYVIVGLALIFAAFGIYRAKKK